MFEIQILKDAKCPICNGRIRVIPYYNRGIFGNEMIVSHGECVDCFKGIVLPDENYWEFVKKYCRNVSESDL